MSKLKGCVKFYNESRGYGFITNSETGEDVFTHATGLINEIKENDQVTFDVIDGKRGKNAVNVEVE